jgi:hypothetical protein
LITSYDPDQASAVVGKALGYESQNFGADAFHTDSRDWFSLHPEQAHRILVAPGLAIVPLDWNKMQKDGTPSRFTAEQTYLFSIAEIALLLNELHVLQIYPSHAERPPVAHAEKLAKAARRFRDTLNEQATERLISDWPELKKFRALTTELTLLANMTADAKQAEAKRQRNEIRANARQTFVREKLAPCFEGLFGRKAGASRPGGNGEVGGPFIRFAKAFFTEIDLSVADETIARDLRRRVGRETTAAADGVPTAPTRRPRNAALNQIKPRPSPASR